MADPQPAPPPPPKRVLIIDPDPLIRDQIAQALKDAGMVVEEAAEGISGVAAVVKNKPDLILIDLHLGGELGGVTVCRKLRAVEEFKTLPMVFLSAERDRSAIVAAIQAGATDFILKQAYSKTLLLSKVNQFLGVSLAGGESAGGGKNVKSGHRPSHEDIRKTLRSVTDVRTLPAVAGEVIRLTRESEVDVKALRAILASDPSLSAKILRIANSAYYGQMGAVQTMDRAIMTLGLRGVRQAVLSISVLTQFPGKGQSLDRTRLWRHSLFTAILGRALAARIDRDLAEEVFIGALLHDLGKAILDDAYPDLFDETIRKSLEEHRSPCEVEAEVLGVTHAQAGKLAASGWKLPAEIEDMIGSHHTPWAEVRKRGKESGVHIGICQAANTLAKCLGYGSWAADAIERLPDGVPALDGLTAADLDQNLRTCEEQFQELEAMLIPGGDKRPGRSTIEPGLVALLITEDRANLLPMRTLIQGQGSYRVEEAGALVEGLKRVTPQVCILGPAEGKFLEAAVADIQQTPVPAGGMPILLLAAGKLSEETRKKLTDGGVTVLAAPFLVQRMREWLGESSRSASRAARGIEPVQPEAAS